MRQVDAPEIWRYCPRTSEYRIPNDIRPDPLVARFFFRNLWSTTENVTVGFPSAVLSRVPCHSTYRGDCFFSELFQFDKTGPSRGENLFGTNPVVAHAPVEHGGSSQDLEVVSNHD